MTSPAPWKASFTGVGGWKNLLLSPGEELLHTEGYLLGGNAGGEVELPWLTGNAELAPRPEVH